MVSKTDIDLALDAAFVKVVGREFYSTTHHWKKRSRQPRSERDLEILAKRKTGWTLAAIGISAGLSAERIRQIIEAMEGSL